MSMLCGQAGSRQTILKRVMALPPDAVPVPNSVGRSIVVRFIRFPINHTPLTCAPQDHFGDNFDDVLDSGQSYYMEDGHIIYDAAPAVASDDGVNGSGNVDGVMMYNTNVSPAADGRVNSSSVSAGSDQHQQLPQSLWSPTTTATTIVTTVTADHDSPSSSKLQVIVSSSPSLCVAPTPPSGEQTNVI